MTPYQKEKARLLEQKKQLSAKYPPEVYNKLKLESEDILAHCRECVRFGGKSQKELNEVWFAPWKK